MTLQYGGVVSPPCPVPACPRAAITGDGATPGGRVAPADPYGDIIVPPCALCANQYQLIVITT